MLLVQQCFDSNNCLGITLNKSFDFLVIAIHEPLQKLIKISLISTPTVRLELPQQSDYGGKGSRNGDWFHVLSLVFITLSTAAARQGRPAAIGRVLLRLVIFIAPFSQVFASLSICTWQNYNRCMQRHN